MKLPTFILCTILYTIRLLHCGKVQSPYCECRTYKFAQKKFKDLGYDFLKAEWFHANILLEFIELHFSSLSSFCSKLFSVVRGHSGYCDCPEFGDHIKACPAWDDNSLKAHYEYISATVSFNATLLSIAPQIIIDTAITYTSVNSDCDDLEFDKCVDINIKDSSVIISDTVSSYATSPHNLLCRYDIPVSRMRITREDSDAAPLTPVPAITGSDVKSPAHGCGMSKSARRRRNKAVRTLEVVTESTDTDAPPEIHVEAPPDSVVVEQVISEPIESVLVGFEMCAPLDTRLECVPVSVHDSVIETIHEPIDETQQQAVSSCHPSCTDEGSPHSTRAKRQRKARRLRRITCKYRLARLEHQIVLLTQTIDRLLDNVAIAGILPSV